VIYYVGKSYSQILASGEGVGTTVSSTFKSINVGADEEIVIIVQGKSDDDQISI